MKDKYSAGVKIIAHRGARSIAPENTLSAAGKAFEAGADLWETDVSVTRDGHLVLFHDQTLERTTDAKTVFPESPTYRLADFTLARLSELNTGLPFIKADPFGTIRKGLITRADIESYADEKIPTLEQALLFTKKWGRGVNLEIKETIYTEPAFPITEKVLAAIRKTGISPKLVTISSFCHEWLEEIQHSAPEIRVQALIAPGMLDKAFHPYTPFDTFNIYKALINKKVMTRLARLNKRVNVYTVNNPKQAGRFMELGVNGIFTDYPQVLCPAPGR
ncbi:MAG: glycerophosphodiester phosphodiesterase [Thermodesulfobacteriota bacterium]